MGGPAFAPIRSFQESAGQVSLPTSPPVRHSMKGPGQLTRTNIKARTSPLGPLPGIPAAPTDNYQILKNYRRRRYARAP